MRKLILLLTLSLTTINAQALIGFVDVKNCSSIEGWAANTKQLNSSIFIEIKENSVTVVETQANLPRPDVGAYLGDNGLHGFRINISNLYFNGLVEVVFKGGGTLSGGSFTLTCPKPDPGPSPTLNHFIVGDKVYLGPGLGATKVDGPQAHFTLWLDPYAVVSIGINVTQPCQTILGIDKTTDSLYYCKDKKWVKLK